VGTAKPSTVQTAKQITVMRKTYHTKIVLQIRKIYVLQNLMKLVSKRECKIMEVKNFKQILIRQCVILK